ncbi:MAG: dodecin family protein [Candidatus Sumerlaeota bacterium]
MSVAKIIEISSASETSFQDAIEQGIQRVNKTVKNVEGVWIKEQKVEVKDGSIVSYRVDMKVTFLLNDDA